MPARETPISFTQVSSDLARDTRLSRRARGLFVELASRQEDGHISVAELAEGGPEGTHALRAAIGELERYGYIVRVTPRDPKTGRVYGARYVINDVPDEVSQAGADAPSAGSGGDAR